MNKRMKNSSEGNGEASLAKEKSPTVLNEERILKFWGENRIFEKSLAKKSPKGEFIFYDGPPFATGTPHYGHILAGTIKDVIPRYKTMRGFHVPRRWGWDCHGLPIENLIEKELGLTSKKDIITHGVGAFNEAARSLVLCYEKEWREIVPRTGRFVDMEHSYTTMDASYTESVWWVFKTLYLKGLIYEGFKAMHLCPRCETTLSNFEVSQGYKDISDLSVCVKFEIVVSPGVFLVAWTTTPWTLPGNAALAVNSDEAYVRIRFTSDNVGSAREEYIMAKSRVAALAKEREYEIVAEMKGAELIGTSYLPPFDYYFKSDMKNKENGWKVYGADFVTIKDGTGIVHIAPAFGEDDLRLGIEQALPFIQHIGIDGIFKPEVSDFALRRVKPKENPQEIDLEILKYLAARNLLFAKEKITHSYPHCWRCETPLLNYATTAWFARVTALSDRLLALNKKINWVPEYIKDGRFGRWLEGAKDWAISRSRFWGAAIPVWRCDSCKAVSVVGSLEDMREKLVPRNRYFVMRHGETSLNVEEKLNSDPAGPHYLTENGREQVQKSARALESFRIGKIVASPFVRTRETAERVAEIIGFPKENIEYDERLGEIGLGIFNSKKGNVYSDFFGPSAEEWFTKKPEGGESRLGVQKRMSACLRDIDRQSQGETVLIVTHDTPARMLLASAQGFVSAWQVAEGYRETSFQNAEIRQLAWVTLPRNEAGDIDLHRPFIDEVTFSCRCGGTMERVQDVFDCWFESGSMPYGSSHYPFEGKETFNPEGGLLKRVKGFPADFIAEGLDQTRGWFYTMLVLGVALFDRAPYKHVIVNGLILAEDGRKMSKNLHNFPDPLHVIERHSADALRFYLLSQPSARAEDIRFSERAVAEVKSKIVNRLENVLAFYFLYAGKNGGQQMPNEERRAKSGERDQHVLDQWILARLREMGHAVTEALETYELDRATRPIADFIEDLSTWYIRRSRERFKGKEKGVVIQTTHSVLLDLSKFLAPFMPFLAEELYQQLTADDRPTITESVHLETWPEHNLQFEVSDASIIQNMQEVRKIVSSALEARAKANVKVRQPLGSLKIKNGESRIMNKEGSIQLIRDEVNIKEVIFDGSIQGEVELDMTITPELKEEGQLRELIRAIQELRKERNLQPGTLVVLEIEANEEGKQFVEKHRAELMKGTSLENITFISISGEPLVIDTLSFKFQIKKP